MLLCLLEPRDDQNPARTGKLTKLTLACTCRTERRLPAAEHAAVVEAAFARIQAGRACLTQTRLFKVVLRSSVPAAALFDAPIHCVLVTII